MGSREQARRTVRRLGSPLVLLAAAAVVIAAVGLLGPSPASPPLGRGVRVHGAGAAWLAGLGLLVAVGLGCAGVLRGLRHPPPAARLLAGGLLATAILVAVAPVGSADVVSYAAYGRAVTTGSDPYAVAPRTVLAQVEAPWRDTPSVYGPLATGEQALASALGGTARATVAVLAVLNGIVFAGVGLVLHRVLRADPVRRARAHLLWIANPVLGLHLVAGVHLDALLAAAALAACLGRTPTRRGAALGVGVLLKASGGLTALGVMGGELLAGRGGLRARDTRTGLSRPALTCSGRTRAVVTTAGVAAAVAGAGYLAAGPHVFDQLRRASGYTSAGSPWRAVRSLITPLAGAGTARALVGAGALALAALLAVRAGRRLPAGPTPARGATLAALAYLFAAAYQLPWYDALPLATLPLLAASRLDTLVVAHLSLLSAGYLPGRTMALPAALGGLFDVLRAVVCPLGVVVVALALAGAQMPLRRVHAKLRAG